MDPIFILTGLGTVIAAVAGLIITCHLERRALAARRGQSQKKEPASQRQNNRPVVT